MWLQPSGSSTLPWNISRYLPVDMEQHPSKLDSSNQTFILTPTDCLPSDMTDSNMAAHILSSVWLLLLCILMPFPPTNALFKKITASDEIYFPFNVFKSKSCKIVCISWITSILLSVHNEEPLNGYAFNLILWSYTITGQHFHQNWTTIMDSLCTKLRRFWHLSHMWFISNTLNN